MNVRVLTGYMDFMMNVSSLSIDFYLTDFYNSMMRFILYIFLCE
jgi:hypothetical protein